MKRLSILLVPLAIACSFSLTSCGGQTEQQPSPSPAESPTEASPSPTETPASP